MLDIQPQFLRLSHILTGRLFRIPEYQRAYSWRHKERADLFGDIIKIAKAESETFHFMATIVGLRREKRFIVTDEYQIIEVVDGQQRLTTLIVLLKAVSIALDRTDAINDRIGRELDETMVKPDQASLLLLQTNHDTSHYFADYLRRGIHPLAAEGTTISDRELLQAMEECESFVAKWAAEGRTLPELVSLLKNRLTFIFHEIADEATVYTVFEVLNSRGLDVSWFDRLKSMLMGIVFEAEAGNQREIIQELHHLWRDIYRCIGLRQGMSTEALRFAATLRCTTRPNRPIGEADAADLFRQQSLSSYGAVLTTTKWIKKVTEAVDRLRADQRTNAVGKIAQARLVATAVHLREDLHEKEIGEILRRWESVTFRIYGIFAKDARTRVGDYVRLAWRITNEKLSAAEILEELSAIGSDFPIEEAIEYFRDLPNHYTEWQEELRYFLFRFEEHLSKLAGQSFDNEQWNRIWMASPSDSIEHILPQSRGPDNLVHRLGNLILLPPNLNSQLGSRFPVDKTAEYEKTGLFLTQQVLGSLPNWNKASIEARENTLLEWARREWAD